MSQDKDQKAEGIMKMQPLKVRRRAAWRPEFFLKYEPTRHTYVELTEMNAADDEDIPF